MRFPISQRDTLAARTQPQSPPAYDLPGADDQGEVVGGNGGGNSIQAIAFTGPGDCLKWQNN